MERIGILGGSFDPVHNAHIRMGLYAKESLGLSRVIYVPTACPPHKMRALTENAHRLEMLRLALAGHEGFELSDYELQNQTYSYTADTLEYFKKLYPKAELVLLVGADSAAYLDTWYKADTIFKTAEIGVFARGDFDTDLQAVFSRLELQNGARITQIPGDVLSVSSAQIRTAVQKGEDISGLVPAAVSAYIAAQNLYKKPPTIAPQDFDLDRAAKHLSYLLKPSRYKHSVGVMETAAKLAERFGYDVKKAQIAGLLHDCAKNLDAQRAAALCEKYQLTPDEITANAPGLMHQLLGPAHAAAEFCIDDKEILAAIGCHTTGKVGMGLLDKILYLADFIEPYRTPFEGLEQLRKLCEQDLDAAMLFALDLSIGHVLSRGGLIHPDTIHARNAFSMKKAKKLLKIKEKFGII